jgi:hypothetical protein
MSNGGFSGKKVVYNRLISANTTGIFSKNEQYLERLIGTWSQSLFFLTGGTLTVDGSNNVHTITSTSNITVTGIGTVEMLVLGGGGGGGMRHAGGGGSGGLLYGNYTLNDGTYVVTIGAGGAGSPSGNFSGFKGGNTTIALSGTILITAYGGGGGSGSSGDNSDVTRHVDGGSGGGGAFGPSGRLNTGGLTMQNTQSTLTGYGFNGGAGATGSPYNGAGGGGAGSVGSSATGGSTSGGNGGTGRSYSISGSSLFYGGGGGGGNYYGGTVGSGGSSIGGAGGSASAAGSAASPANRGSGGGGSGTGTGGNGSSGVVIIRYVS